MNNFILQKIISLLIYCDIPFQYSTKDTEFIKIHSIYQINDEKDEEPIWDLIIYNEGLVSFYSGYSVINTEQIEEIDINNMLEIFKKTQEAYFSHTSIVTFGRKMKRYWRESKCD